jgi:hypothetical protein
MHLKNVVTLALFGTTLAGPIRKRGLATIQDAFQQATRAIAQVGASARTLNGGAATLQLFMQEAQQAQSALEQATQLIANQPATPAAAPAVAAPAVGPATVAAAPALEPATVAAAPAPAPATAQTLGTTQVQNGANALKAFFPPFAHFLDVANPAASAAVTAGQANLVNDGILVSAAQLEAAISSSMNSIAKKAAVLAATTGAVQDVQTFLQNNVNMVDGLVNSLSPFVTDQNVVAKLRADATAMNAAITNTINALDAAEQQAATGVVPAGLAPAAALVPAAAVASAPAVVAPAAAAASVIVAAAPADAAATAPVAVASPVAAAATPVAATGSILDTSK